MTENKKIIPIVESYKPKTLNDVIGRDNIVNELNGYLSQGHVPHLLFEGTQGSGKTLTTELFIDAFFDGKRIDNMILFLDASNDNSVAFIREHVKSFLNTRGITGRGRKIIVFDEMDYLTKATQAALRRPIEKALKRCLVIGTCNYIDNIILPLQSRFRIYHYGSLSEDAINKMVLNVCKKESIPIIGDEKQILKLIYNHSRGELRYVMNNFLEPARVLKQLDEESIRSNFPSNNSYIKTILSGNISSSIAVGLQNPKSALSGSIDYITSLPDAKIPLSGKSKIIGLITQTYRDMTNNIPYHIALTNLSYKLCTIINTKSSQKQSTVKKGTSVGKK